jgi:hypothetical protein
LAGEEGDLVQIIEQLALKVIGRAFDDEEIGSLTWDIWHDKTPRG